MRDSSASPAQRQRDAVIRFPGPTVRVSRKTLEVLASSVEDLRLFYGLSSAQALARDEARRALRGDATPTATTEHVLPFSAPEEESQ